MSVDEAVALHLARALPLVDVRTPREHARESIAGARCCPLLLLPPTVPLGAVDVFLARPPAPGREPPPFSPRFETNVKAALAAFRRPGDAASAASPRPLLLICSSGLRSRQAAELLAEADLAGDALWVDGGLAAWLASYTPAGARRKRATPGAFVSEGGPTIWTDSSEEDTVLPARGGNTRDVAD